MNTESVTQATRQDILRAATDEFTRAGFEATSIEAIAARTRMSKRMVYYHFGSKEQLYEAVLEAAYTRVRRVERNPAEVASHPMEALRQFAHEAATHFMRNPDFVRLMLFENLGGATVLRHSKVIKAISQSNLASMKAILQAGQAAGVMRCDLRAVDVFLTIVALSFHAVSNRDSVKATLGVDMLAKSQASSRRQFIGDLVCRYVSCEPLESSPHQRPSHRGRA